MKKKREPAVEKRRDLRDTYLSIIFNSIYIFSYLIYVKYYFNNKNKLNLDDLIVQELKFYIEIYIILSIY